MRLPFPERIPLPVVFVGAIVLAGLQQLQHTSIAFTIYTFLFIVIATFAFNLAGGFTRPSGSYIFFYSVLGLILGVVYKAFLGEPADSNLRAPLLTIQVFTGGITGMLIAVVISRKLTRKRPFLSNLLKEKDMKNAAIGCFVFGIVIYALNAIIPHKDGTVLSAVTQLDRFLLMSIIIATVHTIRKSGGRTGISPLVLLCVGVSTASGLLAFSKEGMFTPSLCWLIAACSLRLRIRPYQIIIGVAAVYVMFHYLVPYSQYGRTQVPETPTLGDRMSVAYIMLSDLGTVRDEYNQTIEDSQKEQYEGYYNQPEGFFDRLSMIGPDDLLVDYTAHGNLEGLTVIPAYFANWIPHILWPDKPQVFSGNLFAREIGGIIGVDDTTTGISFSPSGEAYHLAGWTGIFLVAPLIFILAFTVFDSLCGDTRKSPWGLLVIALFAHVAPEGMLGGVIYVTWFGTIAIVFVALTSAYVMPLVGTLLAGPEKTGIVRLRRPRSAGNYVVPRLRRVANPSGIQP